MKQELLAELLERLSSFCVHEQLLKELVALVSKGGITPRFLPLFYRRLNQLEEFGVQAPEKHAEFERLDRDLYSMHISSRRLQHPGAVRLPSRSDRAPFGVL